MDRATRAQQAVEEADEAGGRLGGRQPVDLLAQEAESNKGRTASCQPSNRLRRPIVSGAQQIVGTPRTGWVRRSGYDLDTRSDRGNQIAATIRHAAPRTAGYNVQI